MKIYLDKILNFIGKQYVVFEDGEYINILNENAKGNLLLQEKNENIIIWHNSIAIPPPYKVYKFLLGLIDRPLVFPYVDKDEEETVIKLGGKQIDFAKQYPEEEILCADYPKDHGSYMIDNNNCSNNVIS